MNIGVDIVEIKRFNKLYTNDKFMNNIFTKEELDYIKKRENNISTIAGLYAAKEAFLKALKFGLDHSLKDIEVYHIDNAPYIRLHNEIKEHCKDMKYDLSIAHDGLYAIGTVLVFHP